MSAGREGTGSGAVSRAVETAFTLLLVPASAFYIWQATQVPEPPRNIVVGPRTFPLLIGTMMLVISAFLGWQRLRSAFVTKRTAIHEANLGVVASEEEGLPISDWPAVWTVLGALFGLVLLFETLGFVLTIGLFVSGLATLFGPTRWLVNVVVSFAFAVFFYLLFTRILGIPLPNGILASWF